MTVLASVRDDGRRDYAREMVDGASFILDEPEGVPAMWGEGDRVLWAEGEDLIMCGPQGLGKTTLSGLLTAAMISDTDQHVLGLPVQRVGRVLYLAMDRPRQTSRALRRQLGAFDRHTLADRLIFQKGPPPYDLARNTEVLAHMAEDAGADVVVVDSLKDAAIGLSDDEVGAGWNRARQTLLASGRNLVTNHHIVKIGDKKRQPTIDDVYGSTWITSGAGSVILLNGNPGDPIFRMHHLKQPIEEVGPLTLRHDQSAGTVVIHNGTDLVAIARESGGLTARRAASILFDVETPDLSQVEKARRRLNKLVEETQLFGISAGQRGEIVFYAHDPTTDPTHPTLPN